MKRMKLALIGCGGIAGAHVRALEDLWNRGVRDLEVVATCDVVLERARERAGELKKFQKKQPRAFASLDELLASGLEIDAADICSLHSEHHTLALPCLQAGLHVHLEKPLAITLRAGQRILDAAVAAQRVLAVGENYRRSAHERATHWAIHQGRIGRPRLFFWQDVGEGLGKWGWRNFKHAAGGGWMLDGGVHFADLFRYHLGGEAREVYALTRHFEPYRYDSPKERQGAYRVDVEDAALALVRFDDEVVVQWTWAGSAPGQGFNKRVLYGSEGCLDWESGWHGRNGAQLSRDELLAEYLKSLGKEEEEQLFPGGTRDAIAIELKDFADAVRLGRVPEVDGEGGFKAQAICMGVFESGWCGRPLSLQEVERGEASGYQDPLDKALGLI